LKLENDLEFIKRGYTPEEGGGGGCGGGGVATPPCLEF